MKTQKQNLAAIDIGTNSLHLIVAEIDPDTAQFRTLVRQKDLVRLGLGSTDMKYLSESAMDRALLSLRRFKTIADSMNAQVRAIATSAVREALNRDAFLDRIFIATGFYVETIDEADVNSFIYLSIQEHLQTHAGLFRNNTFLMEVGGGSTQFLLLKKGFVSFSNAFRFGSFRIHEMLEHSRAPDAHFRGIMENQIQNMLDQIFEKIIAEGPVTLIILGGDARFAAQRARPDWDKTGIAEISVSQLEKLSEEIL